MPDIDTFIDETVRDLRGRLPQATATARHAIEDCITLLTDYRLSGMDETRFKRLLAILGGGRSPVWVQSRPEALAVEIAQRWHQYRHEVTAAAAK